MKVLFLINEAPEKQRPSGYQNSPQAIVWMKTMTQQEGAEQRSAELQARSAAGLDTLARLFKPRHTQRHTHTHANRWLKGPLKLLSIHLWIILIISKKVMILIFWGWECLCVWLMLISVCSTSPVCQCQAAEPASVESNPVPAYK